MAFLLKKAGRAKAKVLFVEREHSRFALLQAAEESRTQNGAVVPLKKLLP